MNNTAWLLFNYFGKQSVKMLPNNYLVVHTRIGEMHNVTQLTKGLETSQEPKEGSVSGEGDAALFQLLHIIPWLSQFTTVTDSCAGFGALF